jgi:50S ribosomal protein L16 3-hydroxylase
VLQRLVDDAGDSDDDVPDPLYRDPAQPATPTPGAIPEALRAFARDAVQRLLAEPLAVERALGEMLTEPKPRVWFEPGGSAPPGGGVLLDARTRMMYDERHVYINGESFLAGGRDARLMHALADARGLPAADCRQLSAEARALVGEWIAQGWLHGSPS